MKPRSVSATAWNVLDCGRRVLCENYLDYPRDERALNRGRWYHAGLEQIHKLLGGGHEVDPEDVQKLVLAMKLHPADHADILKGLTWWAQRMSGIKPVAWERRWERNIGGIPYAGEIDAEYLNEENGRMTGIEAKSGYLPEPEEAKRKVQNILYAADILDHYKGSECDILMVSLGNQWTQRIEYTAEYIGLAMGALERDGVRVWELNQKLATTKQKRRLLKDPDFAPRVNGFCHSCAARKDCPAYKVVTWNPGKVEGKGRIESLSLMRRNYNLLGKEIAALAEPLKAEASVGPVIEDGWSARIEAKTVNYKAKPASTGTRVELILEEGGKL